jgi:hypothetical protein
VRYLFHAAVVLACTLRVLNPSFGGDAVINHPRAVGMQVC